MKIAIVDYGMGNIKSIESTFRYLGVEDVVLSADYNVLNESDKIILPGVGSFGKAIVEIKKNNLDIYLKEIVVKKKKPLLGICLGMQLLGISSTEDGFNKGLGFINGYVKKFDNTLVQVPHVGFNQVNVNNKFKLYHDFENSPYDFYFTHSYRMKSDEHECVSFCNYQEDFVASFEFGNIAGAQFHPELSQTNGLKYFKNFIEKF